MAAVTTREELVFVLRELLLVPAAHLLVFRTLMDPPVLELERLRAHEALIAGHTCFHSPYLWLSLVFWHLLYFSDL